MAVTLQVVGLYFKQPINIQFKSGPTVSVKEVLDTAARSTFPDGSLFRYSSAQVSGQGTYVDFMLTRFPRDFSSPVSGTRYKAGIFSLRQTFTGLGAGNYTVWQYYIMDKNNAFVRQTPPEKPFEMARVEDGFSVIWRLVEICKAVPVMQGGQAANVAQAGGGEPYINARLAKVIGEPAAKV